MNKVEVIKGIEETIKGLEHIKTALCEVEKVVPFPSNDVKVEKEVPTTEENNTISVGKFDVEQLSAMKYNEFKKFASSLGVKCTGTRDEIMERILALNVVVDNGEAEVLDAEEEVVEEAPKKVEKKKVGNKSAEVAPKDEFDIQAEEVAKETDVEDIIEALSDVGVEANKKNAVSLLANALREGLIELEEDEDEEEEIIESEEVEEDDEDTADVEEDGDEITSESYFSEFDPKGFNDPESMTEERAEAISSKVEEIITAYSEGELTDEEVASYVEDNATEDEIDLLGDEYDEEDILKLYIELVKRTIDNEGEEHEQGEPYEVADKDVCCGHELRYSKKTSKYICEHCGTEYEAE